MSRARRFTAIGFHACMMALVVGGMISVVAMSSCANVPDVDRVTEVIVPDLQIYKDNVDYYLNRRCGSLDCHGQPGRAYRVYSREGLRLRSVDDGGLISGQQPTQDEEKIANFQALVGLEPEEMTRLMATQGEDPEKLLFLRKPLRLERHKGGPAMAVDDPGYRCIVAWLRVPVVDGEGNPIQNRVLSDRAKQFCQEAASFP